MTSAHLEKLVQSFFSQTNTIELYNEFSLQHELGFFLRKNLPNYSVQFEKNVTSFFALPNPKNHPMGNWAKKEIDIVVFNSTEKFAIELKFPPDGAPIGKRMWHFIKDICFVEQLKRSGFDGAFAVTLVTNSNYYQCGKDTNKDGIYRYFRILGTPISGKISNPDNKSVNIQGTYTVNWNGTSILERSSWNSKPAQNPAKYYIITI